MCNILNRREDLGLPKLRADMTSLTSEQRDNTIFFLECSTEELAGLPDGQGIQAMVNVRTLLDYLPIKWFKSLGFCSSLGEKKAISSMYNTKTFSITYPKLNFQNFKDLT